MYWYASVFIVGVHTVCVCVCVSVYASIIVLNTL